MTIETQELNTSLDGLFYELFIEVSKREVFSEHQKMLLGMGYLSMTRNELDFFLDILRPVDPKSAEEIPQIMLDIAQKGFDYRTGKQSFSNLQTEEYEQLVIQLKNLIPIPQTEV